MPSRYYSQKDRDTIKKFNQELIGDLSVGIDGIIYQPVIIYKVSAYDTETNMYGETADGKIYNSGVQISALVEADAQATTTDQFGPDLTRSQHDDHIEIYQVRTHSRTKCEVI